MRAEWLYQLIVLLLFYLNSIVEVDHDGLFLSNTLGIDFLFLLYHVILFLIVNYILIPKLLYKKKYVLFYTSLIGLIVVFGIIEEGVVEKILSPNSRGTNAVNWQSIYWFFGEILIPLLAFITIKIGFDNISKQQELERIEKNNLTNELKFLKSQIQPHLLFNSLNNLYNFALAKSDKAPELILKLSNVLRYMLYDTTTEKVPITKEIAFIEDYIDLQKIQFEGRGSMDYQLVNKVQNEQVKIAPFLLIPFIENSFKHSFGTKIKDVKIVIRLTIEDHKTQLLVRNNFEEESKNEERLTRKGIGLNNVKKRLDLLYPNKYNLNIKTSNDEYCVELNLTLA